MSHTSANRGPCAIFSMTSDISLPAANPVGCSSRRASMNGAIELDQASAICLDDSANDCQGSAHCGADWEGATLDSLFSFIVFLARRRRRISLKTATWSGRRPISERFRVNCQGVVETDLAR